MKHLYINKKEKLILAIIFMIAFLLPYGVGTRITFMIIALLILSAVKIAIDVYKSIIHSQKHFETMQRKREAANREKIIETCNYIYNNL